VQPIWTPSPERASASLLTAFAARAAAGHGVDAERYEALHQWSVTRPAEFWTEVWDFCGVVGDRGRAVGISTAPGRGSSDAALNFTENLAFADVAGDYRTTEAGRRHAHTRCIGRRRQQAARALRNAGVTAGDQVGGIVASTRDDCGRARLMAVGAVTSSCRLTSGVGASSTGSARSLGYSAVDVMCMAVKMPTACEGRRSRTVLPCGGSS
jgi:acetoacetyl-CoA synthetase